MVSCLSSGVSSYFIPYSQAPFITEMGVRSSWEASAVNCFSASKEASRRSNIRSKVFARRVNSLFPGGVSILADRSAASFMLSAVAIISSSGLKALFAIQYPPMVERSMNSGIATPAIIRRFSIIVIPSGTSIIPLTHTPLSQPKARHKSST